MVGDLGLLWRVLEEKVKKMEPHRIIAYWWVKSEGLVNCEGVVEF